MGLEMMFFKETEASLIPRMNIQRGVVIEAIVPMALTRSVGINLPRPKK